MSDLVREHGIVEPILVLAQLQSRFRSTTKYQTFVLADASENGANGVLEYCCGCRHGLRTVGCCSHVMAVIGFLGFMRHNSESLRETAAFLNNLLMHIFFYFFFYSVQIYIICLMCHFSRRINKSERYYF